MEISELLIRVILLFLPGIIAKIIIDQLSQIEEKRHFYFVIYSLVLGFISYFLYGFFVYLINSLNFLEYPINVSFLESLLDDERRINVNEIAYTSLISILLGVFIAFVINKKLFHRTAKNIGITNKFAEPGVWGFLFESSDPTDWVLVRDHKNKLTYYGWVGAFSDKVDNCELFLRDVQIFDDVSGDHIHTTPAYYIARERNEISIEFPALEYTDKLNEPNKNEQKNKSKRRES